MANIQLLELRPAENPIEDLSYKVTDTIFGGTGDRGDRRYNLESWKLCFDDICVGLKDWFYAGKFGYRFGKYYDGDRSYCDD
ncbi:MAG: hypothetical protein QNJ55_33845 [Xenococcus sp. MO_188.B8]|nr:hypothetical protein [Xenococcus sp. MO_188.B8]